MSKNVKTLTVYEARNSTLYNKIPKILIQGNWLKNLGFESGQKINITVSKNSIVIEK